MNGIFLNGPPGSGKDFIAIHVSDNSAPVADAGADQSVALGEMVDYPQRSVDADIRHQ